MKNSKIQSDDIPVYAVETIDADTVINQALTILESRIKTKGDALENPKSVINYLTLKLAAKPAESFCVLFLDIFGGVT